MTVPDPDEVVSRIHRVREELLKKHGGLDGYFKHLQELDRKRLQREKRKAKAKAAAKPRSKSKVKVKS